MLHSGSDAVREHRVGKELLGSTAVVHIWWAREQTLPATEQITAERPGSTLSHHRKSQEPSGSG